MNDKVKNMVSEANKKERYQWRYVRWVSIIITVFLVGFLIVKLSQIPVQ